MGGKPRKKPTTAKTPETVLVLRTVAADYTASCGFKWPKTGEVVAPDWKPTAKCGHGLHGALRGEGDGSLFNWSPDAVWQVVEVEKSKIVDLEGKVKFPSCKIVYAGDRLTATGLIYERYPGLAVIGGTATAGNYGTATAGYSGTATAGDSGTATAGKLGELRIKWWDGKRHRTSIAYVGENGIKANVAYCLDAQGNFVEKGIK